jgi:antitoxin component YwqK of YwqJK toxin-antitoxin module
MKNTLILFVFILLLASCQSEVSQPDEIQETNAEAIDNNNEPVSISIDKPAIPDGKVEEFYPDGNKKIEGMIVEGKRSGVWTSYFPSGNKQSENKYSNGMLNGKTVVYHPNGQIMFIGFYTNNQQDGQWIYFDAEGKMTKNMMYTNGKASELPIDE